MKRVVLILLTCFITAGCTAASLPPVSGDFRLEEDEKRLFQQILGLRKMKRGSFSGQGKKKKLLTKAD
jgi:hypothetical protein